MMKEPSKDGYVFQYQTDIAKYPIVTIQRSFQHNHSIIDVFANKVRLFRVICSMPCPRIIIHERILWRHRSWIQKILFEHLCNEWGWYDPITYDIILQHGSVEQAFSITPLPPLRQIQRLH
jgi:hypothetical protein